MMRWFMRHMSDWRKQQEGRDQVRHAVLQTAGEIHVLISENQRRRAALDMEVQVLKRKGRRRAD